MAETKIEWADYTFNPWLGCSKVSPACVHCYAERDFDHRYQKVKWGPNGTRVLTSEANWREPLKWNKSPILVCSECGNQTTGEPIRSGTFEGHSWENECCNCGKSSLKPRRPRVFCPSLADWCEDWQGPIHNSSGRELWIDGRGPFVRGENYKGDGRLLTMSDVRSRLFDLIDATPNLDWLLLTKRPENIWRMWPDNRTKLNPLPHKLNRKNVWLGTSVENQEYADQRIPELLKCRDLSPVLFLSCEPLLGPVDLCYPGLLYPYGPDYCCSGFECGCHGLPCDPPAYLNKAFGGVDWVIAGGESGPDARPSHPVWFRSLRDQCKEHHVPFLFKQWGEWAEPQQCGECSGTEDASAIDTEGNEYHGDQIVPAPWKKKKQRKKETEYHGDQMIPRGQGVVIQYRVGKKRAGRLLDGCEWNQFPKV